MMRIRNCSSCGRSGARHVIWINDAGFRNKEVICTGCGKRGPRRFFVTFAVLAWNWRNR